jgi:polyphosphate glucokinase
MTDRQRNDPTRGTPHGRGPLRILAFDIGGSHLKAALLDARGRMLSERVSVDTPSPCPPNILIDTLTALVKPLPAHNRIAIAFPGRIVGGRIFTAPNLGSPAWSNFDLAGALARRLGAPARIVNDAEMQGLAVIRRRGIEFVLTLGTGAGTALYRDGEIMPHLELAHHPIHKSKTYDGYLGAKAFAKAGRKRWNKRVARAIDILYALIHYDHLYIGGGNAQNIDLSLPDNVTLVSNDAGIEGGAALWRYDDGAVAEPAKRGRKPGGRKPG